MAPPAEEISWSRIQFDRLLFHEFICGNFGFCKLMMEGFEERIGIWRRLDDNKSIAEVREKIKFQEEVGNSENEKFILFPDEARVEAILPSTSLGGGQSTYSTAFFQKKQELQKMQELQELQRLFRGLSDDTSSELDLQVFLAKKPGNRALPSAKDVVELVLRSPPANNNPPVNSTPTSAWLVLDDLERGIIPSVRDNEQPHSNSANQIDLEAGRIESVLHSFPAAITTSANNDPPVNPTSPGQVGDDAKSGITPSLPLANQTDLEASTSGNQAYDHGHPVGDDADPGTTPPLPRSNSALANQTDLEAARNSSTSGNQPPPHDHGHAEGAEQPPPGDRDSVGDGRANKIEIGVMITGELLSVFNAIQEKDKTPEMSHYAKGLYYTLLGFTLIGAVCYWNAFSIYRCERSSLVSKLLIGTAYAATCFAVLAIIALELPDKFNVGFYLAACAFCVPGVISRATK